MLSLTFYLQVMIISHNDADRSITQIPNPFSN